ncbi:MAG: hypothetical protein WD942_00570 [Dehalococcoidia bacterium]
MVLGDVGAWASRFISFDDRFLECIVAAWPATLAALPSQPDEDTITINLVAHLTRDPVVRRLCHWVEYQFEPFGMMADGAKFSKGKIDIAVLFDWERERYLAYECKRLNVVHAGVRSSLATGYVAQGMMRFLTEQYAEALPVGCMLGYVLDGDVDFSVGRLTAAITEHGPLALFDGPTALADVTGARRFLTRHTRVSGVDIDLRHALIT